MDKLKRFIDCYIETETCNLRCDYCYITQQRKFNNKVVKFDRPILEIRKALSKERLGGTCLINLCAGGETLISRDIIDVVEELLKEGHYIMIVTNGTLTKRFREIAKFEQELLNRLFFKFSFHYLELKRLDKLNDFFENVKKMRDAGASFTIEITPSDELIPYIKEIKKVCLEEVGALCHITIARDDRTKNIDVLSKYKFDKYVEIWKEFESPLFNFKSSIYQEQRNEYCYAGDWSLYLNLSNGTLRQCYGGYIIDNIYNNINKPLKFHAIGHHCALPYCYNGHAFLTLGTIPELDTPTYNEMRDRTCVNGEHWVRPQMKEIMSQKLADNNEQYSKSKKEKINRQRVIVNLTSNKTKIIGKLKKIIK
ncbi:MAG: radical SAM protein [Epulopiscium sp.]|nr:radical SAM protein [Candidatus Epulonipiscium sp.]